MGWSVGARKLPFANRRGGNVDAGRVWRPRGESASFLFAKICTCAARRVPSRERSHLEAPMKTSMRWISAIVALSIGLVAGTHDVCARGMMAHGVFVDLFRTAQRVDP